MKDVIAQLYEAHVRHEVALWSGESLRQALADRVRSLFHWFAEVSLDEAVTREQVNGVIERYAIDLRVSGGITELSGEMSHLVFTSGAAGSIRLDEIMTPEMYGEFAEKVLALEGVRRELIALIAYSATARSISTQLIARGLLDLITLSLPIPNAFERARLALLPAIERQVGRAFERHRDRVMKDARESGLEVFDSERLRSVLDDVWDRVASRPLSEVFAFVGEQDVEDFVVLVYEFWLRYRKTDFFRRISAELVDFFFAKYGQTTLLALVEDMGVTESMVQAEVLGFLPPLFEKALRSGSLERHVRSRLEGFYRSPEVLSILRA